MEYNKNKKYIEFEDFLFSNMPENKLIILEKDFNIYKKVMIATLEKYPLERTKI